MNGEKIIASPFKRSGSFLARSAQQLGALVIPRSPFGVSREAADSQTIIKGFNGRFGVATGLLEAEDADVLEDRAALTAHLMVHERMVDPQTELEIRPLAPEDALRDEDFTAEYLVASSALRDVLGKEHGVHAMANSMPIMPTKHEDSAVDAETFWTAMSGELEGLDLQMRTERERQPAMVAIAQKPYAHRILSRQVHYEDGDLDDSPMLIMQRTGEIPRENLLLPVQTTRLLEAGPPEPRLPSQG